MNKNSIRSVIREGLSYTENKNGVYLVEGEIAPDMAAKNQSMHYTMDQNYKKPNANNPIWWKVILRKNPKPGYLTKDYEIVNIPNEDGTDKGHFIAESFMKFLIPDYEKSRESKRFTFKNNGYNISKQGRNSNRGNRDFKGQWQYENEIVRYFESKEVLESAEVYFEIEEIWTAPGELFGRRIYINFFDLKKEDIHVLIREQKGHFNPPKTVD